ncbi:MAG: PhnD/SsuA/transferrin family substrate-binding protein [Candidatus Polarisedimenticolia bacterium]
MSARGSWAMALPWAMALLAAGALAATEAEVTPHTIVVCSPGSPGNTEQARPAMESLAKAIALAAHRPEESVTVVYHETLEDGLARMKESDASLAMVPLPLLLSHGAALRLEPVLQAVPEKGPAEAWALVAKKGRAGSPAALEGWEIASTAGYAEDFVRRLALKGYALPASARVTPTAKPLAALRRAAAGENVAILLDGAQSQGLAALPFAGDLEVLHRSDPLPGGYLCTIADRVTRDDLASLKSALMALEKSDAGKEALAGVVMTGFRPFNTKELEALRAAAAAR